MSAFRRCFVLASLLIMHIIGTIQSKPALASEIVWTNIAVGIEYAMMPAAIEGKVRGEILVLRVNPSQTIFRVYYEAGRRKTITQWARQNPGAAVIVNANFMRGNGKAVGLVKIGNDILSNPSTIPGSGQFEIKAEVPTIGLLYEIAPQNDQANQTIEPYMESFEGYPLLLVGGKQVYQPITGERRSRRSVVAQDDQGRILVIITKPLELTLHEVIGWLVNSNLNIAAALNLDGGTSSQVYVAADHIPALFKQGSVAVPVVLAIYSR